MKDYIKRKRVDYALFMFKKRQVISYVQFLENLEINCNDFIIKTETYDNQSCPVEKERAHITDLYATFYPWIKYTWNMLAGNIYLSLAAFHMLALIRSSK